MIIPSILTDQMAQAQSQLDTLAQLQPRPSAVQIDIIDGYFTDNLTIEAGAVRELDSHGLPLDIHLMVVEPVQFIAELSGTPLRTVIAQVERLPDQAEFIQLVQDQGWQAGLALDLYTPLSAVETSSWPRLAVLQVMGGEAGHQSEFFHPSTRQLLKEVRARRTKQQLALRIMVDIGINPDTIELVQTAGADDLIVGSYLTTDTAAHWQKLQEISNE